MKLSLRIQEAEAGGQSDNMVEVSLRLVDRVLGAKLRLDKRSVGEQVGGNSPPPDQVFRFCRCSNTPRSKNSCYAGLPQELVASFPEYEAQLFESEEIGLCQFVLKLREEGGQVVGTAAGEQTAGVDVLSAPSKIHHSNCVVENGSQLLNLSQTLPQLSDCPIHHWLRSFLAAQKTKHLIHQIRLAILLCALQFFFPVPTPSSFTLPGKGTAGRLAGGKGDSGGGWVSGLVG